MQYNIHYNTFAYNFSTYIILKEDNIEISDLTIISVEDCGLGT